ncbi:PREDICTED: protein indeterminate-domain 5, chloroplastic-like isoform X1 [Lupinus angustifolius]|uniref:protein indeterminate-domain 5, chloroplastic-like isoform X1 n=1 Tax=Lupinus angustifolius TaxID=3871 RepID=UPI00092F46A9|nr:PREDICTED: protein indeterminate-domain 5, chloroplastic-like isoform X1 [Lupinus angustifolius]
MEAASSSTPFLGIRQENQSQITQHQPSTAGASTADSTVSQKKKRNHPGTPYPDAEVIALSPKTLMATNRFICEVCNKGFQREQNLQLHRRGHNLPWKLKQKTTKEPKRKVYLCPEPTCVHHDPSRALGDLTGIKKHYSRKHGEKKWKCEKCSKKYAVQSDWKAHSKTCGTREYRCDCGTLFSRRDSFITHRAFCDALSHETARHPSNLNPLGTHLYGTTNHMSLTLSQVGAQISHLQNQNQETSNSILSLGNASLAAPKFEHMLSPLHHQQQSSYGVFQSPHSMPNNSSAGFFMNDPNQGFHQELQSHHQQGTISSHKQLYSLMQLPNLQGNTNNNNTTSAPTNMFNPSFFPNSNNSSGSIISDQFNNQGTTLYTNDSPSNHHFGSGSLSSLFGNSSLQQETMSPHMSATALLQKAAQMGSTTTNTNASTMLRGLGSSSNNGVESFGSDSREEGIRSSMENDQHHHIHGFMNSLANGNNSIYGNMKGNESNLSQFHNVEEPNKLSQNLGVCFGGSDKLTLDFLGVGGMVRNMSGRFSQREQQHSLDSMSSLDPKMENQSFGSSAPQ